MNPGYTSIERKAFAKILLEIISADRKLAFEESMLFEQLRKAFEISDYGLEDVYQMSLVDSIAILKQIPANEKETFAVVMFKMITVDGDIDSREIDVFHRVCSLADIKIPENLLP
ncbi:MAG: hypothetical protein PHT77_01400 [Bacteroidales bacterium]|nr:hypothetical protein [Bacteroidales bacterium]